MMALRELIESIPELTADVAASRYEAIADYLNERPLTDNPDPQGEVLKPLKSVDELFKVIMSGDNFEQDMNALGECAKFLGIGKVFAEYCGLPFSGPLVEVVALLQQPLFGLSESTAIAVNQRLAETTLDPNWQAEISGESIAAKKGISFVSSADVQEVLSNAFT